MDNENINQNDNRRFSLPNKRFSLPITAGVLEDDTSKNELPIRRYTLMPVRSILKAVSDNKNVNLTEEMISKSKRRVSFAPEVTLHKINYFKNDDRRQKRRSSLTGNTANQQNSFSKLSTSQFIGKVYQVPESTNIKENKEITEEAETEIDKLQKSPTTDAFIIDEDCTTQTMEMSLELTQQILKQQDEIKNQNKDVTCEPVVTNTNSLSDIFDDIENEISDNNSFDPATTDPKETKEKKNISENDSELDMEFTQTIAHAQDSHTEENTASNITSEISMEMTQPVISTEKIAKEYEIMDSELRIHEPNVPIQANIQLDEDSSNQLMELTDFNTKNNENLEHMSFSQMELTEPITTHSVKSQDSSDNETMELTQSIDNIRPAAETSIYDEKLSTVMELTEPISSESGNQALTNTGNNAGNDIERNSESNTDSNTENNTGNIVHTEDASRLRTDQNQEHNEDLINAETNETSTMYYQNNSGSETESSFIGTEMIPLAEITGDFTNNNEEYDSDNIFGDDSHINVPLDTFLHDVNVQFFDNIGPSESEIDNTLAFNFDIDVNSSSSPGTSISSTSTPSSNQSASSKHANLIEYIDACTNIPYYSYLVHLINQYQTSIQSISTMVNTFSNDVLESNPTAIREFYQQSEQVKNDLCTNYQAIASFTRKQSKCQNLRFLSGLLEQLITSYERTNQNLDSDLSVALEWRRNILIERQKMIEKKVELDQYIQKLNNLKDNWNAVNIDKIRSANKDLKRNRKERIEKNKMISDISESVNTLANVLSEKESKKKQLMKEIEELKINLKKYIVPKTDDFESLKNEFAKLEKSTSVKLINKMPTTILILNKLKVVFTRNEKSNNFFINLDVQNRDHFAPFTRLIDIFLKKYTTQTSGLKISSFIKYIRDEWVKFIDTWKDLCIIYYTSSGEAENDFFKFKFKFSKADNKIYDNVIIEGAFKDLLEDEKQIHVTLHSKSEKIIDSSSLLTSLKVNYANKNSIINRFTFA